MNNNKTYENILPSIKATEAYIYKHITLTTAVIHAWSYNNKRHHWVYPIHTIYYFHVGIIWLPFFELSLRFLRLVSISKLLLNSDASCTMTAPDRWWPLVMVEHSSALGNTAAFCLSCTAFIAPAKPAAIPIPRLNKTLSRFLSSEVVSTGR